MEVVSSSNYSLIMMVIFSVFTLFFFQHSHSAIVVVDGVSQWQNPTVQIGDSIVFKHKYGYKVYIFQNRRAFNLCNFTQATLLTSPNSNSYTWHPSRLGFFYFSFNKNASPKACQDGQKLAITVSLSSPPENFSDTPEQPPVAAPLPSSGGIVSSTPVPWPFRPRESITPSPAPIGDPAFPTTSPSAAPEKGGGGIPFINSNPAVPLPTGEVDSAVIRPLPASGDHRIKVVGLLAVQRLLCFVGFMMML